MFRRCAIAILLTLAAMANLGCASATAEPPGYLVALVAASAPEDDVYAAQFCAGTLISDREVLTAAHCVRDKTPQRIHALVGANNLCQNELVAGERVRVESIRISEDFDGAIITLEYASSETPAVPNIEDPGPRAQLYAWGWGKASAGGVKPCVAEAKELVLTESDECSGSPSGFGVDYLCAVPSATTNTCEGDSGGPLVGLDGSLAGIVSSGLVVLG